MQQTIITTQNGCNTTAFVSFPFTVFTIFNQSKYREFNILFFEKESILFHSHSHLLMVAKRRRYIYSECLSNSAN